MAATMNAPSPATAAHGLPADPTRNGAQKQFEMEALTHSLELLGRLEDKDIHRVHGLPSHSDAAAAAAAAGLSRSQGDSSGHGDLPSLAASRASSSSSSHSNSQSQASGDEIQVLGQEAAPPTGSSSAQQKQKEATADEMLLPRLSKDDVEYASVDVCDEAPKLRDIRSQLVKQYPFLVAPPEPKPKARKPNAPPPALLPKPRVLSDEEKAAREKSLVVRLEDVEYRNDVKGLVVLESRRREWRNISEAPENAEATPLPTNLPSPWLLDIDGAALLAKSQKAKKTFALPSHKYISSCVDCRGAGTTQCTGCQGIESDECFWCEGTGFRRRGNRCDVCEGKTTYQCTHCKNEGVVKCKSCSGHGKALVGLFVTVKMRCIELPPIRLEKLVGQDGLADEAAIRAAAVDKVLQAVMKLRGEAAGTKKAPFVPVMARCLVEKSVSRTFSVLRPLHENWKDAAKAFEDATPAEATGLEAMVAEEAYPSPFAALSRANSNLFAFEGMDPKTQVESRRYKLSSAPGSVPKDITPAGSAWSAANSTRTSPAASRAVSRDVSPSSTPAGLASLSPRTSVANLQTLFKQVERQKSFLSLPGSPTAAGARTPATPGSVIDGSSGSATGNGMGLLDENTAHFMAALQRQQRLYSMPGQGSAAMFGSAGGSLSGGSVKKRASISKLFTRSGSNSGPSSPVYSPGFQFGFTPATAGSGPGPKSRSGSASNGGFAGSRRNRQSSSNLAAQAQAQAHPAVLPPQSQTVPNTPMQWNNEDPFRNVQVVGEAK